MRERLPWASTLALCVSCVSTAGLTGGSSGLDSSSASSASSGGPTGPNGSSTASSNSTSSASSGGPSVPSDAGSDAGDGGLARVAFVTSQEFASGFGGLTMADAKCGAAGFSVKGHTRFKAWLSDDTHDAIDRIAELGPWYNTDRSALLFSNKQSLATLPSTALTQDETGATIGTASGHGYFWTGTLFGGTKASANCSNWTGADAGSSTRGQLGIVQTRLAAWTDTGTSQCDYTWPRRLLCIEQ